MLGGLLICCGGGGEDPASTQASLSPSPYLVSAPPSILFATHQDHMTQSTLATDAIEAFRNDQEIV